MKPSLDQLDLPDNKKIKRCKNRVTSFTVHGTHVEMPGASLKVVCVHGAQVFLWSAPLVEVSAGVYTADVTPTNGKNCGGHAHRRRPFAGTDEIAFTLENPPDNATGIIPTSDPVVTEELTVVDDAP
jgi:hypothetical protein